MVLVAAEATPDQDFRVHVAPRGVVRLRWTPGLIITAAHVIEAMAAVDQLNGPLDRPLLVEMTGIASPTIEAREHFGRRCTASRIALLGESPVDRVRASFAPSGRADGFPVPTRFFTSEPAAVAWLLDDPNAT
jgi:hypothetical protein